MWRWLAVVLTVDGQIAVPEVVSTDLYAMFVPSWDTAPLLPLPVLPPGYEDWDGTDFLPRDDNGDILGFFDAYVVPTPRFPFSASFCWYFRIKEFSDNTTTMDYFANYAGAAFFVGNFDYFDGDFFPCDEAWAQLPATRDFHESVNHDLIDRGLVTSNVNVTHNFFWDVPVVKIPTDQGILYEVDVFSEPDSNVMYPWISFDASNPSTCWTQDEQIAVLDDIPPWTDNLTITNGGCNLHPNGEIAQGYNLDFHIAILLTNDGVMKYHDEDGSHLHSFDPYWIENRSAWTFLPHHRLHPFHDWYSAPQINGSYGGLGNPPLQVLNASIEPSYVGQFAPS